MTRHKTKKWKSKAPGWIWTQLTEHEILNSCQCRLSFRFKYTDLCLRKWFDFSYKVITWEAATEQYFSNFFQWLEKMRQGYDMIWAFPPVSIRISECLTLLQLKICIWMHNCRLGRKKVKNRSFWTLEKTVKFLHTDMLKMSFERQS